MCRLCGRSDHSQLYRRRMTARREALLRDARDPKSGLSDRARAFIIRHDGHRVPWGYEVSHETPLYTEPRAKRCTLDTAENMKTQQRWVHRKRHKKCGDQFHEFRRSKYKHLRPRRRRKRRR